MKLLLKILFFLFAIFSINISEARVVVFDEAVSETIFSNIFNSGKSNVELQEIFSESGIVNTCKSKSDLVNYRNLLLSPSSAKCSCEFRNFVVRAAQMSHDFALFKKLLKYVNVIKVSRLLP